MRTIKFTSWQDDNFFILTVRSILPPVHEIMAAYYHLLWKHH
ncbi:MAG: hypothetical protein WCP96_20050 [Methylococcaceae bacterium]